MTFGATTKAASHRSSGVISSQLGHPGTRREDAAASVTISSAALGILVGAKARQKEDEYLSGYMRGDAWSLPLPRSAPPSEGIRVSAFFILHSSFFILHSFPPHPPLICVTSLSMAA